jgi:hypothetical protein
MIELVAASLQQSWSESRLLLAAFLPRLIAALVLAAGGWVAGAAVRAVLRRVADAPALRRFTERTKLAETLRFAELPPVSALLPGVVFWLIWLAFLAAAVDVLVLPGLGSLRVAFVDVIVRVLRATLVVVVGVLAANVVWRVTLLGAFNAGLPSARLIATAMRLLILAIAVVTALTQLGLPLPIVLTAFSLAFGAVMLGLALAFGLGGRHLARQALEQQSLPKHEDQEGPSHL